MNRHGIPVNRNEVRVPAWCPSCEEPVWLTGRIHPRLVTIDGAQHVTADQRVEPAPHDCGDTAERRHEMTEWQRTADERIARLMAG